MLVGDSWGLIMCGFGTFNVVLSAHSHSGVHTSCILTTKAGTTAAQWATDSFLKKIDEALASAPKADIFVVSLGGNDFIHAWNVNMTQAQDQALYEQIKANIEKVILHIRNLRPGAKILISSYDYPNFDILKDTPVTKTYVEIFNDMGKPSPKDLNAGVIAMESVKRQITQDFPSVYYVTNLGLMQYYFGQSDYGIAPKILPKPGTAPDYLPFAGGHPDLPGPPESFLSLLPTVSDPYHLSFEGFRLVVENLYAQYLGSWL